MTILTHLHCPNFRNLAPWLACTLTFFFACSAGGETVLDLTLNDPKALLSSHPEGLSHLTPVFTPSMATIASGSGGRALPQITRAPAMEASDVATDVNYRIASEPPMGSGPFFRAVLEGGAITRQAGLSIMLDKEASLGAFVFREGSSVKISGAFDFLFRATASADLPKLSVMTKLAHLGVVAGITPEDGKLVLRLSTNGKSLDTNGDQTGDRSYLEKRSDGSIENGAIYHAALIFRTSPDGSLSLSFLVGEGVGPLDPTTALSATIEGIWLLDEPEKPEIGKLVITLGRSETSQQTLDIGAVRVFRQVPELLPAFNSPKG